MQTISVPRPPSRFDASSYPRIYLPSLSNRIVWLLLGIACALGGILGAWYFVTGHDTRGFKSALFSMSISSVFVWLGSYLVLSILRSRVVLNADDIEVRGVFSTQRIRRGNIAAWRIAPTNFVSTLELFLAETGDKTVRIGMTMRTDPSFEDWFASIPNRDAEEVPESEARVRTDVDLGSSIEERSARLDNAARIGKWLTGLACTASLWGWFYPRPYQFAIAVLVALSASVLFLKLRRTGLYQIDGRRNDIRPSLAVPFIVPSAVLALRAILDFSFLEWKSLLAWVFVVGAGLTFLLANSDAVMLKHRFAIASTFLFASMYAFGVLAQADTFFDRSPRETFQATVLGKHSSQGRSGTTWYINVAPWGPMTSADDVSVSRSVYVSVSAGETVCINLASGALKIPWYVVTTCHESH
jgi:hypothetical protein